MSDVVQKLWGFCHTLRHDGIDYGDYIEQITYLLFLKMSDERGIGLIKVKMRSVDDPKKSVKLDCAWPALTSKAGTDLTDYYANVLRALG
ncbi:type I restriction-modification system subunit M N-terminal domain-containing protein [Bythopirellula goksoeyrii]|uniref:type I restriction-modification system subunit M N-terminal domain-containing protein n=1 Tax=Bythopirellula goksoeyrii TaxID=1400387 RepID=UPI001AEFC29F|nr:type I restriction-modification system subunit M N-terminal domain-containing protein [Bythopirellula goksoeyrii]